MSIDETKQILKKFAQIYIYKISWLYKTVEYWNKREKYSQM